MAIHGLPPLTDAERRGVDLAKSEHHLIHQLTAMRIAAGLTPAELARRMEVDRSAISRFEACSTNPTMATINRYAEAVGAMITYRVQPHVTWTRTTRDAQPFASRLNALDTPRETSTCIPSKSATSHPAYRLATT